MTLAARIVFFLACHVPAIATSGTIAGGHAMPTELFVEADRLADVPTQVLSQGGLLYGSSGSVPVTAAAAWGPVGLGVSSVRLFGDEAWTLTAVAGDRLRLAVSGVWSLDGYRQEVFTVEEDRRKHSGGGIALGWHGGPSRRVVVSALGFRERRRITERLAVGREVRERWLSDIGHRVTLVAEQRSGGATVTLSLRHAEQPFEHIAGVSVMDPDSPVSVERASGLALDHFAGVKLGLEAAPRVRVVIATWAARQDTHFSDNTRLNALNRFESVRAALALELDLGHRFVGRAGGSLGWRTIGEDQTRLTSSNVSTAAISFDSALEDFALGAGYHIEGVAIDAVARTTPAPFRLFSRLQATITW